MLVRDKLFTARAEVEVFADRALVASAHNREGSAAVTFTSLMSHMRILWLEIIHNSLDILKSLFSFNVKTSLDKLLHALNEALRYPLIRGEMLSEVLLGGSVYHKTWLSLRDLFFFNFLVNKS